MSNKKKAIIIAIIAILATFIFGYAYLTKFANKSPASTPTSDRTYQIVLAEQDIPANTKITSSMIKYDSVSSADLKSGAIVNNTSIEGSTATSDIKSGEQILINQVKQKGTGFANDIPSGMRTVTFSTDDYSGVAGSLKVGDYVDIIGSYSPEGKPTTSLLVEKAQVASLGSGTSTSTSTSSSASSSATVGSGAVTGAGETATASPTPAVNPTSSSSLITLYVKSADVEKVVWFQKNAQLTLTLRNPDETGSSASEAYSPEGIGGK